MFWPYINSNKSIFMFWIKEGWKKEWYYYHKTASNWVKMKVFFLLCIKAIILVYSKNIFHLLWSLPFLHVFFLWGTLSISLKMDKKGKGPKSWFRASRFPLFHLKGGHIDCWIISWNKCTPLPSNTGILHPNWLS